MKEIAKVKLKGSKILVTGGCGFIGSHLVERLVSEGAKKITVIDSLKYGDKNNIGKLANNVEVIKHKLGGADDNKVLAKTLKNIDCLFHLAAEKHREALINPLTVLEGNILGTFNLLDAAVKSGVKKILFSSSVSAYDKTAATPFKETDAPKPQTVYGISKLAGEHLLRHFYEKYKLNYITLRYFFVYGPKQFRGMGYKSVIVKNFEHILKNKNPVIFGDGKQVLDYIYIDDAVDITVKAMESAYSDEIFNVGSSIPTTINHLTDAMLKVARKNLKKIYGPPDETYKTYRVADITKIKKKLGFWPSTSLEEGLKRTYNWMKGTI